MNDKINNISITEEQQQKVRQNSASSLPLNPTAQGWSAQKIREKLYRAICSDVGELDDNLLDIIVDKLLSVKEVFEALQSGEFVVKKAELSEGGQNIEITFQNLQNRMNVAEQDINKIEDGTTVVNKALKDDLGNTIKSTYANQIDLVYSSSNNRIAITLKSADGTTIDADLITLPKATTSADGLLAKEDKVKINNIASDIAAMGATKQSLSEKNQINGYAGLDTNAKIPSSLLPDSVLGQLEYKGTFTPTAYPSSPEKGWFYISIGNGTIGGVDFQVGDWAVFNGTTWDKVDNTDAVMSVNGKLGVVVLNGTDIKVGNGDTWTIEQRIVNIYAELNNRYTKAQTYSQTEIEQRLTDLLGMANLQDILIGSYTDGQTVSASDLSDYNFVIVLGKDLENTYTGTFKPSEIVSGNVISLSPTVYLTRGATDFTITTPTTVKLWGIKLDGITADEIGYGEKTVEDALDEVLAPSYITATHEALQTEITATNAFEINDETGDVIKITGNEVPNLTINSTNEKTWDTYYTSLYTYYFSTMPSWIAGNEYFLRYDQKIVAETYTGVRGRCTILDNVEIISPDYSGFQDGQFHTKYNIFIPTKSETKPITLYSSNTATNRSSTVKNVVLYDITHMKNQGVKNDAGIPFINLTHNEIEEQINIWIENGFPTVVEKLISKSDNLFNGTFTTLTSLESENLIPNSDLLIDSNSDNIPDGFIANFSTISLSNGLLSLTANAQGQVFRYDYNLTLNSDILYFFANVKSSSTRVVLGGLNNVYVSHSGSGEYELLSQVGILTNIYNFCRLTDNRTSDWTPIDVDYMGAINITDLVTRGILPSGLSNAQYKEMIDNAMFTNVPLRETDYIAVEPSKTYKLIKASGNAVTHKVIEYTTDDQVVRVNTVTYTANKYTFTTHALTAKVKLISDLLDRVPQLIAENHDFTEGITGWRNSTAGVTVNPDNTVTIFNDAPNRAFLSQNTNLIPGNEYYVNTRLKTDKADSGLGLAYTIQHWAYFIYIDYARNVVPAANEYGTISKIFIPQPPNNTTYKTKIGFVTGRLEEVTTTVDYIQLYNISDMKKAGVRDDNGTLFSRLTNDEIKDQMDIWTEVGFPDHVIHALYPDGVDSAIALKYNDADDTFRPQQIDELPLNLTLRSGEYWQDGYVIKQNGNAEYHPLQTKFSAWNYGQLEAVYTSGVPADFDIQFAQNTAAQVKTTGEFLVEAREQLDYVTDGYDNLVEKLGDAIFSDKYDSYAGITADTYEYYTLEGVKEGNTLAIEGAGQSIQNLLGKNGTINATTTTRGITVTYDSVTGVFTANGTATAGAAFNITLATGMDFGLPVGTPMQLMRYYDDADGGTVDLNGSYIGYVLVGTSASNRINENSEALYDPYINGSGNLKPNHATDKQQVVLQVWAPGIVFTNFKFKIGIYEGLQLRPFILPSGETAKSNVTVYNRTANMLNMPTALNIEDSGITLTYDPLVQEFLLSGTATATKDISLNATFNALSGDRLSIKRLYQSGDITAAGGTLPRLKLVISGGTAIVYNDIYKMTAPEGETPTPDVTFNTGTAPADATLTLKLGITNGQVFDNYRFRLMIHDKSTDIGYVAYRRDTLGNMSVGANERAVIEFKAIPYGILEFVADSESLNLLFADGITDLNKTYLEYNAGIISPNRKISELTARAELIDNPFRNKVIAVWGDSRESNNPTSDPSGVGDQKDTSWPALLAKKLGAKVLNFGLSGGAWAENTFQQDAESAIVNRVQTEDVSASADVIVISSMNDFKLASVLGSPLPANKDKTTFYGAMRLTYDRLAAKYPGKKILLVLPQKRYDEDTNYGGGSYYHYLKAQVEVANEYGIPIVDLYHNLPITKPIFYDTYMLNDTHFSAVGNDWVAELVARELIGNGNKGNMDVIPPIPTTDGTYTLKVTITGGIPVFSWVAN